MDASSHLPGHLPVSPFEPPAMAALFSSPVRFSILSLASRLDHARPHSRGQSRVLCTNLQRDCSGTVITSRHAPCLLASPPQAGCGNRPSAIPMGCFDSQHPHPRPHPTKPARRSPAGGCKSSKATAYGQPAFQFTVVRRINGLGKSTTSRSRLSTDN